MSAAAAGVAVAVGLFLPGTALAGYQNVATFAKEQLTPLSLGVATDDASGEVFLADGFNAQIRRFGPSGQPLGSWGWDVVQTGPDKAGTSLQEEIHLAATAGEYSIRYEGSETTLQATASAKQVEEAFDALPSVLSRHGQVHVEGGPGDQTASHPYLLTYEAGIGDQQQSAFQCTNQSLSGGEPTSSVSCPVLTQGAPAFEDCLIVNGDVCRIAGGAYGEGPGQFITPSAVAVDQATGDVFVFDSSRQTGVVQVYDPAGHPLAAFGHKTNSALEQTPGVELEPEALRSPVAIAVDAAGDVYVADRGPLGQTTESRVVAFKPQAGSWAYSGVLARRCGLVQCEPEALATDAAGHLYLKAPKRVYELSVQPEAILCESPAYVHLEGLAVGPAGEAFVFDPGAKSFHELAPCQAGQLAQGPSFTAEDHGRKPLEIPAIALNPTLRYEADPERPRGILYALEPSQPSEHGLDEGLVLAQAKVAHPSVLPRSEGVSAVGTAGATLHARIDTAAAATHYAFLYSTESISACLADHSCLEAPPGGALLGTLSGEEAIAAAIGPLQPATTYHYTLTGYSNCNPEEPGEQCALTGAEERAFTTFLPAAGLPDHRAYELVSPARKDGGEVFPALPFSQSCFECNPGAFASSYPLQASPDGEALAYEGTPFSAAGATVGADAYLATRTASGWRTAGLSSELEPPAGHNFGFKAYSSDLSRAVLAQAGTSPPLCPEAPPAYDDLYLLGGQCEGASGLQPLLTASTPHQRDPAGLSLAYAGASADLSHVFFTANDALLSGSGPLEEELSARLTAELANHESHPQLYEWHAGQLALIDVLPNGHAATAALLGGASPQRAVSADGSRVFWTEPATGRLFLRENAETTRIPGPGAFLTATPDGSRLLLDDGCLYSLAAEECQADLTEGHGGFQGILGASEDLSSIYFVDTAVLSADANPFGSQAQAGKPNLYLYRDGAPARYLATLSPLDGANGAAFNMLAANSGDWTPSPADRTAQASPDGRYLAFMSEASLTGYDNSSREGRCGVVSAGACTQVYLYDSATGRLACPSCDPTGERPLAGADLSLIKPDASDAFLPQLRYLTDSGRLFFQSAEPLSPLARNPGVEDVYEWEPDGLGTCESEAQAGGCLSLISSGTAAANSNFLAADPAGKNVFFTTRSQLLPADTDDLIDVYDARENGGIAAETEAPRSECQGAACQHPTEPPTDPTPASSNYQGPGNLEEPAAKPKKHHHKKRHHKRAHKRHANSNRRAGK